MHRADLTKLAPVSEAHFTDMMGAAFRRFHEKYKDADPHTYYVNFNPVASDPRDKTIVGQQSDHRYKAEKRYHQGDISLKDLSSPLYLDPSLAHADPVGTYAYPIDYVINHWYDMHYGKDMRYMRVIRAKTGFKYLRLANMTREYFLEVMKNLNLEFYVQDIGWMYTRKEDDAIAIYEAIFEDEAPSIPHFRVNSYGKVVMKLIQNDFKFIPNGHSDEDDEDDEDSGDDGDLEPDYEGYSSRGSFRYQGMLLVNPSATKQLSAQKQNERARKAGYDAIWDKADTPVEATIHPNEPEQCIFLTKRTYDVVEVFPVPTGFQDDQSQSGQQTTARMLHKVSGLVANVIKDSIIGRVFIGGKTHIVNLNDFRHWLATEQHERQAAHPEDPTMQGNRADGGTDWAEGWSTKRGRLIVVSPLENADDELHQSDFAQRFHESKNKIRVRPGEHRTNIIDSLDSYLEANLNKPTHREKISHNNLAFLIGIVGEWPEAICVRTDPLHAFSDVERAVRQEVAKAETLKHQMALQGIKVPFKHIDGHTIQAHQKSLAKATPPTDPAAGEGPENPA